MNVHFVAIKISIEGSTDALVESEGFPLGYLHSEAHHGDSMQTRLTVKNDNIIIS